MRILDLGCGKTKHPGAVGLDIIRRSEVDVVWDMDKYPYPFPDNSFDWIIPNHSIEQIATPARTV